jgi:hypothetical protein
VAQVGPLRKHLGPGCARLLRLCSGCCSVGRSSGRTQLCVLSLKVLTPSCLPIIAGYVVPSAHYSVAEEVSPDFEAALSHFQVERVR